MSEEVEGKKIPSAEAKELAQKIAEEGMNDQGIKACHE